MNIHRYCVALVIGTIAGLALHPSEAQAATTLALEAPVTASEGQAATVADCNGLRFGVQDWVTAVLWRQINYKLMKGGVTVASSKKTFANVVNYPVNFTFEVPTEPGVYSVTGNTTSGEVTVVLKSGVDCTPPITTQDFGADIWFEGSKDVNAPLVGDFDNDGFEDDIVYSGKCGKAGTNCWRLHLGNKTKFSTTSFGGDAWFFSSDPTSRPVVGDFDNDGYKDDVAYNGKCGNAGTNCWRLHLGNKTSFTTTSFGGDAWFAGSKPVNAPVVGDFDNDGFKDDIAYSGKCGNAGTNCWRLHLGNKTAFTTTSFGNDAWFDGNSESSAPIVGDFDNDGFEDDVAYNGKCGTGTNCWRVHLGNKTSFTTTSYGSAISWFASSNSNSRPVVGDFDGDGRKDDIAYHGRCGVGAECWRVHLSNGTTFSTSSLGDSAWFQGTNPTNAPVVGDFDNDGQKDDIAYYGRCGSDSHECWRVHIKIK